MAVISLSITTDPSGAIKGIRQFTGEVEKLDKKGSAAARRFSTGFDKAGLKIKRAAEFAGTAVKRFTVIAGLGLAAGLGVTIKRTIDLEKSMLSVRKTTGLSAKTIDTLRKDFINLSTAIPISARELAEIGAVAGQLGIQNAPDILKFTETIAKVATVTNFTAEEAATSLARIANVFKIPIAEIENLAGVMNELENTTTAKVPQIADFMRRLGPASLQIGLSASEVAGLSATLIDLGFRAELAGTAVSNTFANMIKKADVFGKQMGLTAAEFRLAIQKDGIGTIQKWAEAISKLPADQVIAQFEAVGISGSRARLVFNALSNSTELMGKNLKTASDEVKRGTSLQKEFDIFISGTASKLRLLGNRLGQAAFAIGDVLLPVVNDLIKTAGGDLQKILDGVADKFTKNKDAVRELLDKGYIQFKETSKGILNVMRDLKQPFLDVVSIIGDLAKIFLENVTFFGVGGLLGSIFFGKIGAVGFLAAITATDKTVKFLAESLNGAIDTTDRLNDQIKLLEQQIRTGTKLEDGLFGFSKVVPASTEDLIAMEKQLANLKKTVKEIDEPIKKPFVTVQTETKKVLTTLEEAQLLILKLGQKQVPNFIVSQLEITKVLKKEISIRRKLQLQAFALEEGKIKEILKTQTLANKTRIIGIKDLTRVVKAQEKIQIEIVRDAANEKLLEIEAGSRAEALIKENAAEAIVNIERATTEKLRELKKEVTQESAAQLLIQVNDENLTAKARQEIHNKLNNILAEGEVTRLDAFRIGIASQLLSFKSVNQQIADFGIATYGVLKDSFKSIVTDALKGNFKDIGNSFKTLMQRMLDLFIDALAQMAAQAAASAVFRLLFPGALGGGPTGVSGGQVGGGGIGNLTQIAGLFGGSSAGAPVAGFIGPTTAGGSITSAGFAGTGASGGVLLGAGGAGLIGGQIGSALGEEVVGGQAGSTIGGIAGGAAAGTLVAPGIGTVIGGIVGGLSSIFADGGIIKEPTILLGTKTGGVGLMAEQGPEAIVPLGGGGGKVINVFVENLFAKDLNSIIDEVNSDNQNRNIGDFRLMVEEQNTENFNLVNS